MRREEARGEQVRQLVPEQRIQRRTAFKRIRSAQEQSGCNGVGMDRSLDRIARSGQVGLVGNALERCGCS